MKYSIIITIFSYYIFSVNNNFPVFNYDNKKWTLHPSINVQSPL